MYQCIVSVLEHYKLRTQKAIAKEMKRNNVKRIKQHRKAIGLLGDEIAVWKKQEKIASKI